MPVIILRGHGLWVWCPGCGEAHRPEVVSVDGSRPAGPCWDWDGNIERPTISPSLLVSGVQWAANEPFHDPNHNVAAGGATVCHSFIRDGHWQFLADSTHALAGQTVPMVPLPDWLVT